MRLMKVNEEILNQALDMINEKYDNNIEFKRKERISNSRGNGETWAVTLKPINSRGPGGRISATSLIWDGRVRYVCAACWHAHGDFFDAILYLKPDAVIVATGNTRVFKDQDGLTHGNWKDKNIGSYISPLNHSQACLCGRGG